jgi:hypothetical protein
MDIEFFVTSIKTAPELLIQLLSTEFGIGERFCKEVYDQNVAIHFNNLKNTIYLFVETNYIDKTYRDSYYNYYSSKSNNYIKYCIRISLFDKKINIEDVLGQRKNLQKYYRGFIILRPTPPQIIGRSVISPKALKDSNCLCCISKYSATVGGIKYEVEGFPHSSQDAETITCAEASLWAIMEYFGNKFCNYQQTLPSIILQKLEAQAFERQIPSKGLYTEHISFVLKQFGFGSRVYNIQEFNDEFEGFISCYIESGIPLIVLLENDSFGPNNAESSGHALLVIGHEKIYKKHTKKIKECIITKQQGEDLKDKNIKLYDYDSIEKKFIFIDDNRPVYQKELLKDPTSSYKEEEMRNYKIKNFIVPLYQKIYLEVKEAKSYIIDFIAEHYGLCDKNTKIVIRTFLASSRSFKDEIANNDTLDEFVQTCIAVTMMPKFIWVAEVTDKKNLDEKKAIGMIILDATEANIMYHKPFIAAFFPSKSLFLEKSSGLLEEYQLNCKPFKYYTHNLTSYK